MVKKLRRPRSGSKVSCFSAEIQQCVLPQTPIIWDFPFGCTWKRSRLGMSPIVTACAPPCPAHRNPSHFLAGGPDLPRKTKKIRRAACGGRAQHRVSVQILARSPYANTRALLWTLNRQEPLKRLTLLIASEFDQISRSVIDLNNAVRRPTTLTNFMTYALRTRRICARRWLESLRRRSV